MFIMGLIGHDTKNMLFSDVNIFSDQQRNTDGSFVPCYSAFEKGAFLRRREAAHVDHTSRKAVLDAWSLGSKLSEIDLGSPHVSLLRPYIYLEPKWPLFWLEKALFWGVDLQK